MNKKYKNTNTCGFCEKPCNNDWCATKRKDNRPKTVRRLLIDDTRDEASTQIRKRLDVIARNYWEGIRQLQYNGPWDELYLDHDLASYTDEGKEYTGYDIICWLEENPAYIPPVIKCVSSNPIGAKRINEVIQEMKLNK